jgi:O-antigen ligase
LINVDEGVPDPPVDARFAWQARVDPLGRRIHLATALLWCFLVAGPTSVVEWAGLPMLICWLIRLDKGVATLWPIVKQPLVWLVLGYYAWMALSLTWTPDVHQGLDEIATIRWLVLLPLLWPVLDRRDLLVIALAAGFIVANFGQLAQIVDNAAGLGWIDFHQKPGRNSGWLDPVPGAAMLIAVLGLHLPEALLGPNRHPALVHGAGHDDDSPPHAHRRTRLPGVLGCLITIPAIFVTGTRGAWITGSGLIAFSVAYAIGRVRPVRRLAVALLCIAVGAAAIGAGAWSLAGKQLAHRAEIGVAEVRRALTEHDYDSDTGARVLMWRAAGETFARQPLTGVGAGGFRTAMAAYVERHEVTKGGQRLHDHAHSAPLQLLATLGLPGLLLAGAVAGVAPWGGFRGPPEQRAGYGLGPAFAMAGLALAGTFDSIQVSTQTGAMLFTILVLCYPGRPRLESARKLEEEERGAGARGAAHVAEAATRDEETA